MISDRLFTTLFASVATDSASWSTSPVPVRKLSHAAFAAFIDPSIVVEASFAVVPVIPSSVCTSWIAV